MNWTEKDLENLKAKGMKIDDSKVVESAHLKKIKKKIEKISVEKETIKTLLWLYKREGKITDYVEELQFHNERLFRFDWAIPDLKIAIEYEGLMSKKSGHTTVKGYSKDTEKYNLAAIDGWIVLRYTALNYNNLHVDLKKVLKKMEKK